MPVLHTAPPPRSSASPRASWEWPRWSPAASARPISGRVSAAREWNHGGADKVGGERTALQAPPYHLEGVWRVTNTADRLQSAGPSDEDAPIRPEEPPLAPPSSSAAASFFLRAAQKLNLSKKKKSPPPPPSPPEPEEPVFYSDGFSSALQLSPPPVPPSLLRAGSKVKDGPGMGKVKVMVRISSSRDSSESKSFLKVDTHKKTLSFCEPRSASSHKSFSFDTVYSQDASQVEICSGTLPDVLQAVVNGADGCIFCFGHAHLGKSFTLLGSDGSSQSLGIAPCSISWLFKLLEERREKTGTRFSVGVSAVEISGRDELLTDLLSGFSPAASLPVSLREDPVCGSQLLNQTEMRVYSAERAAFFLDAALASRSGASDRSEHDRRNSHMLFSLHITQNRSEKSSKAGMWGSRSRLHLLDLGSCEWDAIGPREGGRGQCLSLEALGNVIFALTNGAKQVPHRESKLTMLLRESLGNINCRTTVIAHISDSPAHYAQSLFTVQLASRIHRSRKKKAKYASSSSGGESSCEEGQVRRGPFGPPRTVALDPEHPALVSSEADYSSSSEHSCDTVIYVGPGGSRLSDWELSDNEAPPTFVPIIPSLNKKRPAERTRSDGDHLKCNTFAELQERLECIDGSGEVKGQKSPNPEINQTVGPDHKVLGKESLLKTWTTEGDLTVRTPPVGMSQQAERGPHSSRSPLEVSCLRAALRSRCLDPDVLRTTVTLQQPLELNGEDELVFTVVEELPLGRVPDNGRPSSTFSCYSDCSLQALASGSRPVSIISSINDEFDAYMSQLARAEASEPEKFMSRSSRAISSWSCRTRSSDAEMIPERGPSLKRMQKGPVSSSMMDLPGVAHVDLCSQHTANSSMGDSAISLSELDFAESVERFSISKWPPSPNSTKALLLEPKSVKTTQLLTSQAAQMPLISHCTLPRKSTHTLSSRSVSIPEPQRQVSRTDVQRHQASSAKNEEFSFLNKSPKGVTTGIPSRKTSGSSHSVPRPPKTHVSTAQRIVEGCEKSSVRKSDLSKMPQLRRGATTLGTTSESKWSGEGSMPRFASLGKKSSASAIPKSGSMSPPAPPVRKSSLEQKTRGVLSPTGVKSGSSDGSRSSSKASVSEEDCDVGGEFFSFRSSSLRAAPGLRRSGRGDSGRPFGSLMSLERSEDGNTMSSNVGKPGRSSFKAASPPAASGACKPGLVRVSVTPRVSAGSGSKGKTASPSKSSTSGPRNTAPARSNVKPARASVTGVKQTARATNSRVSELQVTSKQPRGSAPPEALGQSGGSGVAPLLPSPYSKITAPRRPQRYSSGHGSDSSSVLSGEMPPAMGRTALFYHSGASSGYESVMRDSETTGSASSMSESGASSSGRTKISKSPKRRSSGLQRRRLIPAALPDASSLGRKMGVAGPLLGATVKESFEIKVYEIDDVERLQRGRDGLVEGLQYFSARLRMLEKRQQNIRELDSRYQSLKKELEETQTRLMLEPRRWTEEFDLDPDLDRESQEYLEALAQATGDLEFCVSLCKSRVMMETCFDAAPPPAPPAPQEMEV